MTSDDAPRPPATQETPEGVVLARWLPYRCFIVAARVAEVLQSYYGPAYGLTLASWRALAVAGDRPGLSAREIGEAAGLDQFAASRAIAQLVELGFARRDAAARDRRFASVALTAEGAAAFADVSRLARALEAELLAGLDERERAALDRALAKLDAASAVLRARGWRDVAG